ncbi:MAG: response regulator [Desulfobacterales bacterium]|jgi:DNA-binding NtrC family response regulator
MAAKDMLEGKRILLVDDEPDVLDTLEDLLSMCETVKASNFNLAKDYLESEHFDLAVLDIMGVEGYQLLEIAGQREVTSVMLTAHALSPENVVKSYKEGAASYLPKEEMVNIASFLNDVLEAKELGKNPWSRWYDRMGAFFEKKFGPKWQDDEKDFWEKFPFY